MKKKLVYILADYCVCGMLFLCFCGCGGKDPQEVPSVPNVNISFNWKNLKAGEPLPSGMKLYFYPSQGVTLSRDATSSGFNGNLPAGTYQVLVYNTDGENVQQRDLNSYEKAQVYSPVYTRASSYLHQPSHCYGVGLGTLTVVEDGSFSGTMTPLNFVRQAAIKVETGDYADQIKSCSGSLSGFSTGAYISSGELAVENGKLYFDTQKLNSSFNSTLSFFGKDTAEKNILHMEFVMTEGSTQFLNVDITDRLKDVNTVEMDVQIDMLIEVLNQEAVLSSITIKARDEVNGGEGEVQ